MREVLDFPNGDFRFVRGVEPYSGVVAALSGFEIERARFTRPVALAEGFARIAAHLQGLDRPLTALCACELRSPAQCSEEGFRTFNQGYLGMLERWGLFRTGINPVARCNVCPEREPPSTPSFFAFSYTVPARPGARRSFVSAGAWEMPDGPPHFREFIVRRGDTSPDGMREKARFELAELEQRMAALGFTWADTTATQVYTVHDLHPFLADEIVGRGAARAGVTWYFARPPVMEFDYEMDTRGVTREIVI
jgi:hypothetical protein